MKKGMIILTVGFLLVVVVAQGHPIGPKPVSVANDQLVITETAAGILTATLNGVPVALMLGGTTDHWSVSLPSGYSFSGSLTGPIIVGEPEDTNSKNNISAFTTNGHFTWESDIGAPATTAPSTVTMTSAGTDPAGKTFDLILTDAGDDPVPAVPDSGSAFGLLCLALAAVFGASRLRSIRFT